MFGRPTKQDEIKAQAYGRWLRDRHPFALASVVLGVFSLTHFGTLLVDSIAAIVLGVLAIRNLRSSSPTHPTGSRLAFMGIATGAISLAIALMLYLRIIG
jgi:hypothetical protein